jgi:hypothetical protein
MLIHIATLGHITMFQWWESWLIHTQLWLGKHQVWLEHHYGHNRKWWRHISALISSVNWMVAHLPVNHCICQ